MDISAFLKELKSRHVLLSVGVFLGTVGTGLLITLQYRPDLFIKLDVIKLVLFALALMLPLVLINLCLATLFLWSIIVRSGKWGKSEQLHNMVIFVSCCLNFIACYPSLLAAYYLDIKFGIWIVLVLIFEGIFLAFACVMFYRFDKRSSASSRPDNKSSKSAGDIKDEN